MLWPTAFLPTNTTSSAMFDCFAEIWFSVTLLWRTKTLVSPHTRYPTFTGICDLVLFHQLWVSQLSVRVFMVSQLKTKTREPQ
nr:MAG TPA: hypothetical protein [Caudoviricetes sp.]